MATATEALPLGPPSRETRDINGKEVWRERRECPVTGVLFFVVATPPRMEVSERIESVSPERVPLYVRRPRVVESGFSSTRSPAERFGDLLASNAFSDLSLTPPMDPVSDDLSRLRDQGFIALADALESKLGKPQKKNPEPGRLFDPGNPVQVSLMVSRLGCVGEQLSDFLARHTRGDHGQVGCLEGISPTAEDRWAPCLPTVSTLARNAVALESGHGLIVSRYPLQPLTRPEAPPDRIVLGEVRNTWNRDDLLSVVSLLVPGRATRTVVFSTRDTISLAEY